VATLLVSLAACWPGGVLADIYKCTDGEGLVTFTDSPSRKFSTCLLLYRDPAPVSAPVSAPVAPGATRQPSGATGSVSAPGARPGSTPAAAASPRAEAASVRGNPGPENFPRIERSQQRDRDLKARQIVERELASEQRLLDDVRTQMAALATDSTGRADPRLREWQNAASRHLRNIAEIQRQLSLMK